mmetsp:Transcript_5777/g.14091  ORF Transcript_5777/g.14091 Transcript_5777/m.14091 type:complete len:1118 (+) Transcript_5777:118-3471(+)
MDEALAALRGYGEGSDGNGDDERRGREHEDRGSGDDGYYDMDIDQLAEREFGVGSIGGMVETPLSESDPNTPLKSTPLMERAGTPVMSNNSKNGTHGSRPRSSTKGTSTIAFMDDGDDDDGDENIRMPVETPMQLRFKARGDSGTPATGMKSANKSTAMTMTMDTDDDVPPSIPQYLNQGTFRRYHDALRSLVLTKRSIQERQKLEQAANDTGELVAGTRLGPGGSSSFNTMAMPLSTGGGLEDQSKKAEIEFCKTLCNIAYTADRPAGNVPLTVASRGSAATSQADDEGHLWNLLAVLAKPKESLVIWHDDSSSMTQFASSRDLFLRGLTGKINLTPKEIVEALKPPVSTSMSMNSPIPPSSSNHLPPPAGLQRKFRLVEWIRSCLEHEKKTAGISTSSAFSGENLSLNMKNHPDSSEPTLLSEMDELALKRLVESCLMHILQGNIKEAQNLIRSNGQPWRAAAWGGGAPDGYDSTANDTTRTVERKAVGNPERFLWKRQVWKTGRSILQNHMQENAMSQSSQGKALTAEEEAAIYSILACDVESALQNPCLRSSWTKSLCVLLSCLCDRIEDSTLHNFNKQRRLKLRPATFPGSQYEREEIEQIHATADLAKMSDSELLLKLESSVYHQNQLGDTEVSCKSLILAFIAGQSAILDTCSKQSDRLLSGLDTCGNDWVGLRLLTHLLVFLSSLDAFGAPFLSRLVNYKNEVLFRYVQYMVTRPDLSHFCALYVHMLPPQKIFEFYPSILVRVLNNGERNLILQQIEEYMPQLMTPILNEVVRMALCTETYGDSDDPAEVDRIKSDSLQWLLRHDEHLGDALICANMLIRDFLNDKEHDKMDVAMAFLQTLPDFIGDQAGEIQPRYLEQEGMENKKEKYFSNVNNARQEYKSYERYLESYSIFCEWKETEQDTPVKLESSNQQNEIDPTRLSEEDQQIALQHIGRDWLKSKKEACRKVVDAAESAREALYDVLTIEGGWLYVEDTNDDDGDVYAVEGIGRNRVVDHEEVSRRQEMNEIRSQHLVSAVSFYLQVCEDTAAWLCRSLDDSNVHDVGMTREAVLADMDREASPSYWYDRALDIVTVVASDNYKISNAFDQDALQRFLAKVAEAQVSKLMSI